MTFGELTAGIDIQRLHGNADGQEALAVVSDSRLAGACSVFVCISGMSVDGHDYAREAYRRGCRIFVVERALDLPEDACQYRVRDGRIALALLSRAYYGEPDRELLLVGVTGTKGKTTVASMAMRLLSALGVSAGYIGSNGVSFLDVHEMTANTTPESSELYRYFRRMADAGVRVVVMEVSSQALYLHRVEGMRFPIALFTNLAPDHIGGNEHPSFEHYRACKASLFSDYGCDTVICNRDDEAYREMLATASAARQVFYSVKDERADYFADSLAFGETSAEMTTSFSLHAHGACHAASLTMPGEFNVSNALAAIAVCDEVLARLACVSSPDGQIAAILDRLPSVRVSGRFEVVSLFADRAFIIDYAHNGYSLRAVLEVLRAYKPSRLICLVGSVGGRTYGRRAELGEALSGADLAIITSDNPDFENPRDIMEAIAEAADCPKILIEDRADAIAYAVEHSRAGDIVLLAGKGHENYQLIRGVREPFCERSLLHEAALRYGGATHRA